MKNKRVKPRGMSSDSRPLFLVDYPKTKNYETHMGENCAKCKKNRIFRNNIARVCPKCKEHIREGLDFCNLCNYNFTVYDTKKADFIVPAAYVTTGFRGDYSEADCKYRFAINKFNDRPWCLQYLDIYKMHNTFLNQEEIEDLGETIWSIMNIPDKTEITSKIYAYSLKYGDYIKWVKNACKNWRQFKPQSYPEISDKHHFTTCTYCNTQNYLTPPRSCRNRGTTYYCGLCGNNLKYRYTDLIGAEDFTFESIIDSCELYNDILGLSDLIKMRYSDFYTKLNDADKMKVWQHDLAVLKTWFNRLNTRHIDVPSFSSDADVARLCDEYPGVMLQKNINANKQPWLFYLSYQYSLKNHITPYSKLCVIGAIMEQNHLNTAYYRPRCNLYRQDSKIISWNSIVNFDTVFIDLGGCNITIDALIELYNKNKEIIMLSIPCDLTGNTHPISQPINLYVDRKDNMFLVLHGYSGGFEFNPEIYLMMQKQHDFNGYGVTVLSNLNAVSLFKFVKINEYGKLRRTTFVDKNSYSTKDLRVNSILSLLFNKSTTYKIAINSQLIIKLICLQLTGTHSVKELAKTALLYCKIKVVLGKYVKNRYNLEPSELMAHVGLSVLAYQELKTKNLIDPILTAVFEFIEEIPKVEDTFKLILSKASFLEGIGLSKATILDTLLNEKELEADDMEVEVEGNLCRHHKPTCNHKLLKNVCLCCKQQITDSLFCNCCKLKESKNVGLFKAIEQTTTGILKKVFGKNADKIKVKSDNKNLVLIEQGVALNKNLLNLDDYYDKNFLVSLEKGLIKTTIVRNQVKLKYQPFVCSRCKVDFATVTKIEIEDDNINCPFTALSYYTNENYDIKAYKQSLNLKSQIMLTVDETLSLYDKIGVNYIILSDNGVAYIGRNNNEDLYYPFYIELNHIFPCMVSNLYVHIDKIIPFEMNREEFDLFVQKYCQHYKNCSIESYIDSLLQYAKSKDQTLRFPGLYLTGSTLEIQLHNRSLEFDLNKTIKGVTLLHQPTRDTLKDEIFHNYRKMVGASTHWEEDTYCEIYNIIYEMILCQLLPEKLSVNRILRGFKYKMETDKTGKYLTLNTGCNYNVRIKTGDIVLLCDDKKNMCCNTFVSVKNKRFYVKPRVNVPLTSTGYCYVYKNSFCSMAINLYNLIHTLPKIVEFSKKFKNIVDYTEGLPGSGKSYSIQNLTLTKNSYVCAMNSGAIERLHNLLDKSGKCKILSVEKMKLLTIEELENVDYVVIDEVCTLKLVDINFLSLMPNLKRVFTYGDPNQVTADSFYSRNADLIIYNCMNEIKPKCVLTSVRRFGGELFKAYKKLVPIAQCATSLNSEFIYKSIPIKDLMKTVAAFEHDVDMILTFRTETMNKLLDNIHETPINKVATVQGEEWNRILIVQDETENGYGVADDLKYVITAISRAKLSLTWINAYRSRPYKDWDSLVNACNQVPESTRLLLLKYADYKIEDVLKQITKEEAQDILGRIVNTYNKVLKCNKTSDEVWKIQSCYVPQTFNVDFVNKEINIEGGFLAKLVFNFLLESPIKNIINHLPLQRDSTTMYFNNRNEVRLVLYNFLVNAKEISHYTKEYIVMADGFSTFFVDKRSRSINTNTVILAQAIRSIQISQLEQIDQNKEIRYNQSDLKVLDILNEVVPLDDIEGDDIEGMYIQPADWEALKETHIVDYYYNQALLFKERMANSSNCTIKISASPDNIVDDIKNLVGYGLTIIEMSTADNGCQAIDFLESLCICMRKTLASKVSKKDVIYCGLSPVSLINNSSQIRNIMVPNDESLGLTYFTDRQFKFDLIVRAMQEKINSETYEYKYYDQLLMDAYYVAGGYLMNMNVKTIKRILLNGGIVLGYLLVSDKVEENDYNLIYSYNRRLYGMNYQLPILEIKNTLTTIKDWTFAEVSIEFEMAGVVLVELKQRRNLVYHEVTTAEQSYVKFDVYDFNISNLEKLFIKRSLYLNLGLYRQLMYAIIQYDFNDKEIEGFIGSILDSSTLVAHGLKYKEVKNMVPIMMVLPYLKLGLWLTLNTNVVVWFATITNQFEVLSIFMPIILKFFSKGADTVSFIFEKLMRTLSDDVKAIKDIKDFLKNKMENLKRDDIDTILNIKDYLNRVEEVQIIYNSILDLNKKEILKMAGLIVYKVIKKSLKLLKITDSSWTSTYDMEENNTGLIVIKRKDYRITYLKPVIHTIVAIETEVDMNEETDNINRQDENDLGKRIEEIKTKVTLTSSELLTNYLKFNWPQKRWDEHYFKKDIIDSTTIELAEKQTLKELNKKASEYSLISDFQKETNELIKQRSKDTGMPIYNIVTEKEVNFVYEQFKLIEPLDSWKLARLSVKNKRKSNNFEVTKEMLCDLYNNIENSLVDFIINELYWSFVINEELTIIFNELSKIINNTHHILVDDSVMRIFDYVAWTKNKYNIEWQISMTLNNMRLRYGYFYGYKFKQHVKDNFKDYPNSNLIKDSIGNPFATLAKLPSGNELLDQESDEEEIKIAKPKVFSIELKGNPRVKTLPIRFSRKDNSAFLVNVKESDNVLILGFTRQIVKLLKLIPSDTNIAFVENLLLKKRNLIIYPKNIIKDDLRELDAIYYCLASKELEVRTGTLTEPSMTEEVLSVSNIEEDMCTWLPCQLPFDKLFVKVDKEHDIRIIREDFENIMQDEMKTDVLRLSRIEEIENKDFMDTVVCIKCDRCLNLFDVKGKYVLRTKRKLLINDHSGTVYNEYNKRYINALITCKPMTLDLPALIKNLNNKILKEELLYIIFVLDNWCNNRFNEILDNLSLFKNMNKLKFKPLIYLDSTAFHQASVDKLHKSGMICDKMLCGNRQIIITFNSLSFVKFYSNYPILICPEHSIKDILNMIIVGSDNLILSRGLSTVCSGHIEHSAILREGLSKLLNELCKRKEISSEFYCYEGYIDKIKFNPGSGNCLQECLKYYNDTHKIEISYKPLDNKLKLRNFLPMVLKDYTFEFCLSNESIKRGAKVIIFVRKSLKINSIVDLFCITKNPNSLHASYVKCVCERELTSDSYSIVDSHDDKFKMSQNQKLCLDDFKAYKFNDHLYKLVTNENYAGALAKLENGAAKFYFYLTNQKEKEIFLPETQVNYNMRYVIIMNGNDYKLGCLLFDTITRRNIITLMANDKITSAGWVYILHFGLESSMSMKSLPSKSRLICFDTFNKKLAQQVLTYKDIELYVNQELDENCTVLIHDFDNLKHDNYNVTMWNCNFITKHGRVLDSTIQLLKDSHNQPNRYVMVNGTLMWNIHFKTLSRARYIRTLIKNEIVDCMVIIRNTDVVIYASHRDQIEKLICDRDEAVKKAFKIQLDQQIGANTLFIGMLDNGLSIKQSQDLNCIDKTITDRSLIRFSQLSNDANIDLNGHTLRNGLFFTSVINVIYEASSDRYIRLESVLGYLWSVKGQLYDLNTTNFKEIIHLFTKYVQWCKDKIIEILNAHEIDKSLINEISSIILELITLLGAFINNVPFNIFIIILDTITELLKQQLRDRNYDHNDKYISMLGIPDPIRKILNLLFENSVEYKAVISALTIARIPLFICCPIAFTILELLIQVYNVLETVVTKCPSIHKLIDVNLLKCINIILMSNYQSKKYSPGIYIVFSIIGTMILFKDGLKLPDILEFFKISHILETIKQIRVVVSHKFTKIKVSIKKVLQKCRVFKRTTLKAKEIQRERRNYSTSFIRVLNITKVQKIMVDRILGQCDLVRELTFSILRIKDLKKRNKLIEFIVGTTHRLYINEILLFAIQWKRAAQYSTIEEENLIESETNELNSVLYAGGDIIQVKRPLIMKQSNKQQKIIKATKLVNLIDKYSHKHFKQIKKYNTKTLLAYMFYKYQHLKRIKQIKQLSYYSQAPINQFLGKAIQESMRYSKYRRIETLTQGVQFSKLIENLKRNIQFAQVFTDEIYTKFSKITYEYKILQFSKIIRKLFIVRHLKEFIHIEPFKLMKYNNTIMTSKGLIRLIRISSSSLPSKTKLIKWSKNKIVLMKIEESQVKEDGIAFSMNTQFVHIKMKSSINNKNLHITFYNLSNNELLYKRYTNLIEIKAVQSENLLKLYEATVENNQIDVTKIMSSCQMHEFIEIRNENTEDLLNYFRFKVYKLVSYSGDTVNLSFIRINKMYAVNIKNEVLCDTFNNKFYKLHCKFSQRYEDMQYESRTVMAIECHVSEIFSTIYDQVVSYTLKIYKYMEQVMLSIITKFKNLTLLVKSNREKTDNEQLIGELKEHQIMDELVVDYKKNNTAIRELIKSPGISETKSDELLVLKYKCNNNQKQYLNQSGLVNIEVIILKPLGTKQKIGCVGVFRDHYSDFNLNNYEIVEMNEYLSYYECEDKIMMLKKLNHGCNITFGELVKYLPFNTVQYFINKGVKDETSLRVSAEEDFESLGVFEPDKPFLETQQQNILVNLLNGRVLKFDIVLGELTPNKMITKLRLFITSLLDEFQYILKKIKAFELYNKCQQLQLDENLSKIELRNLLKNNRDNKLCNMLLWLNSVDNKRLWFDRTLLESLNRFVDTNEKKVLLEYLVLGTESSELPNISGNDGELIMFNKFKFKLFINDYNTISNTLIDSLFNSDNIETILIDVLHYNRIFNLTVGDLVNQAVLYDGLQKTSQNNVDSIKLWLLQIQHKRFDINVCTEEPRLLDVYLNKYLVFTTTENVFYHITTNSFIKLTTLTPILRIATFIGSVVQLTVNMLNKVLMVFKKLTTFGIESKVLNKRDNADEAITNQYLNVHDDKIRITLTTSDIVDTLKKLHLKDNTNDVRTIMLDSNGNIENIINHQLTLIDFFKDEFKLSKYLQWFNDNPTKEQLENVLKMQYRVTISTHEARVISLLNIYGCKCTNEFLTFYLPHSKQYIKLKQVLGAIMENKIIQELRNEYLLHRQKKIPKPFVEDIGLQKIDYLYKVNICTPRVNAPNGIGECGCEFCKPLNKTILCKENVNNLPINTFYESPTIGEITDYHYYNDLYYNRSDELILHPNLINKLKIYHHTLKEKQVTKAYIGRELPDISKPAITSRYTTALNATSKRVANVYRFSKMKLNAIEEAQGVARVYFHKHFHNLSEYFRAHPVGFSYDGTMEWFKTHPNPAIKQKELINWLNKAFNIKSLTDIKAFAKLESFPKFEIIDSKYDVSERMIMGHNYAVAALFSPVFETIKKRFKQSLSYKFKYLDGMTEDEVEQLYNSISYSGKEYLFEDDASKQDRQTTQDLVDIEFLIYNMLGLDDTVAELFRQIHNNWRAYNNQFRLYGDAMRITGSATTAIGNAIVNCIIHREMIENNWQANKITTFLGDDHHGIYTLKINTDLHNRLSKDKYNMETKSKSSREVSTMLRHLVFFDENNNIRFEPDVNRLHGRLEFMNTNHTEQEIIYLRKLSYAIMLGGIEKFTFIKPEHRYLVGKDKVTYDGLRACSKLYNLPLGVVENTYRHLINKMNSDDSGIIKFSVIS